MTHTNTPDISLLLTSKDPGERRNLALKLCDNNSQEARKALITLLGDSDWRVRKTAVEAIAGSGKPDVFLEALLKGLYDNENAGLRNAAAETLYTFGDVALTPILDHLSATPDDDVVIAILNLLSQMGQTLPLEKLLVHTQNSNKNIVSAAISVLGRCCKNEAYDLLFSLLDSKDLWITFHAVEAFGDLGDSRVLPTLESRYKEGVLKKSILRALGKIGQLTSTPFLTHAMVEREKINLDALDALYRIYQVLLRMGDSLNLHKFVSLFRKHFPENRLDELVQRGMGSERHSVQAATLDALGWIQNETSMNHLIGFLKDEHLSVLAQSSLARIGVSALPVLTKALPCEEDDGVLISLIETTGFIGCSDAIISLDDFCGHEQADVRFAVVEALCRIGTHASLPLFRRFLEDSNNLIQERSVAGMTHILVDSPSYDTAEDLKSSLKSEHPILRKNALTILVRLSDKGSHDSLLLASKDEDQGVRQRAIQLMGETGKKEYFDLASAALNDESSRVRESAVRTLGHIQSPEALNRLITLLEDEDMWVRAEAAEVMGQISTGQPEVFQSLVKHFETDVPPVRISAIKALGKAASKPEEFQVVYEAVASQKGEIRLASIEALKYIPETRALEILLACLNEKKWKITSIALDSLVERSDASSAADSLTSILLNHTDPLVLKKTIAVLSRLKIRDALSHVLSLIEEELLHDEIQLYLQTLSESHPDFLQNALRHASPKVQQLADDMLPHTRLQNPQA